MAEQSSSSQKTQKIGFNEYSEDMIGGMNSVERDLLEAIWSPELYDDYLRSQIDSNGVLREDSMKRNTVGTSFENRKKLKNFKVKGAEEMAYRRLCSQNSNLCYLFFKNYPK